MTTRDPELLEAFYRHSSLSRLVTLEFQLKLNLLIPAMLSGSFRKKIKHDAVFLKGDSQIGCVRLGIACLLPVMLGRAAER